MNVGRSLCVKNKAVGTGRGKGHRICQNISGTGPRTPVDQSDGGTSTRPTQTTDTAMTSQHEAVVLQQGCASAEPLQGRAGNAWNSPGAKGWGLLELGWAWTGRQGTAGRGELGWGPSLKAPARFWSGANGHTASWVLCKEGEEHRPYSSCSGSWRAAGSQRGGHHGRPWLYAGLSSPPAQAELGCCPLPGASSL